MAWSDAARAAAAETRRRKAKANRQKYSFDYDSKGRLAKDLHGYTKKIRAGSVGTLARGQKMERTGAETVARVRAALASAWKSK